MKLLTMPLFTTMLLTAARPWWLPLFQGGGDMFGISRTIDHAVYTLLNSGAIILWRLNAALIAMSLFSYNTQDWLMRQNNGGVWQVLEIITGPSGFLGVRVWMALFALALTLFGFSYLLRPFVPRFHPVDPGQMLIYGIFSYVVIQQGATMMVGVEQWRADVGDWMYEGIAARGSVDIDLPGVIPSGEPLYPPGDLDGRAPIRGWEAVATSYFLVTAEAELNDNIPPEDFRVAYCLYDPDRPINEQTTENSQGCSPRIAWDEWDYLGSTGVITSVWGIELPISLGYELPILDDHPENRELAIRQAQGGVARLALGPIVALYPMLEANISLMLALSAAILYLTIPIILLFGFFLYTQPLVNRLLLRFLTILINTIILHGLIGLLLLLLINVSVNGSLSAYLGLVGVAVLGGFILGHVALGTLKETLSTAMSAVGGVWMGAATTAMGREAAPAARGMLGTAKLLGTGAAMGAAGMGMIDLAFAGRQAARSGLRDLDAAGIEASGTLRKQAGQLPAPLARLAREELDTQSAADSDPLGFTAPAGSPSLAATAGQFPGQSALNDTSALTTALAGGALIGAVGTALPGHRQNGRSPETSPPATAYSQGERQAVWQAVQETRREPQYTGPDGRLNTAGLEVVANRLTVQGYRAFQSEPGQRDLAGLITAQPSSPQARGWGVPEGRQGRVDQWLSSAYLAQESGRGQNQVQAQGESLFGEQLGPGVARVVARRGQAEMEQALAAVRQAALRLPPAEMAHNGQLTRAGRAAMQAELSPVTTAAFQGAAGQRDLETLATAALQPEVTPAPTAFRQALAEASTAQSQPPATIVAQRLGLDAVATGPHFSGINHFTRLSDEAGLTPVQRERLVTELQTQGQASPETRADIEASLARQAARGRATGLHPDDLIRSAQALPETLTGPALPGAPAVNTRYSVREAAPTGNFAPLTAISSGEIPQIAAGAAGTVADGVAAHQAESKAASRETAAALRQPVADAVVTDTTTPAPTQTADALKADSPDTAPVDLREAALRQMVTETEASDVAAPASGAADDKTLRPPLIATPTAPVGTSLPEPTAPLTPSSRGETVLPANAQDQATGATATEPRQVAAALREQAKAEVFSAQETAVASPATAGEAAANSSARSAPMEHKEVSGRELKAAALVTSVSSETITPGNLAGSSVAPGGGSPGVAAALRRGRVDDDAEEAAGKKTKSRQANQSAQQSSDDGQAPSGAESKTGAQQETAGNDGQVISLLPHHLGESSPSSPPAAASAKALPDPDRTEIEADAALARADRRGRSPQPRQEKVTPKRTPSSQPVEEAKSPRQGRISGTSNRPAEQPQSKNKNRPTRRHQEGIE